MAKSLYPLDRAPSKPMTRITVELTEDEKAEIQLVADLWNAFDRARGVKEGRKWERKPVLEQFIRTSLENFWEQIGGKPPTAALRESAIKAAIAKLVAEFGEKATPKK